MQIYTPPLSEYRFLLETFAYDEQVKTLPGFEEYDLETVMALVQQGGVFATERLLPMNRIGDQAGLDFDAQAATVTMPEGFKSLYKDFCEQGYPALTMPTEYGGSGAPLLLAGIFNELFVSTNKSFSMCPGLTHGLSEALIEHGSDEQKKKWLPKLISGQWSGTMCLTEPQCGTDLGLVTTKAVPDGDAYRLTGTKIWITFGEHDLSENILHLVLARLPDAPEGIKGISVFVVPKFLDDGTRNGIQCTGLEHKMGIKASPTCVMSMEDATGYLVGTPHKGMRTMFVMMNSARLLVGLEGLALSEIAYQTALAFAKDRRQGRALDPAKQEEGAKADNILVHPDVRRQLLNVKVLNEGMRAFAVWLGIQLDISIKHPDDEVRERADDLVALMTPVVKAFFTDRGFEAISESMQVCGGAGYTTDWSIEQYLRDERIALIYEGTNHIQALDLVGRKLPKKGGQLYRHFAVMTGELLDAIEGDEAAGEHHADFKAASDALHETTMALGMKGMQDFEEAGAVATPYLTMFGYVALAYFWIEQLRSAKNKDAAFFARKQKMARYFFKMHLPEVESIRRVIAEGKEHIMAVSPEELGAVD